jgi:hypothetical protein
MRNKWFLAVLIILCATLSAQDFVMGKTGWGIVMLGFTGVNVVSYMIRFKMGKANEEEKEEK